MVDSHYLLQCMFKSAIEDKQYLTTISGVFKPEYFDSTYHSEIFKFLNSYIREYNEPPQTELVINSVPVDVRNEVKSFFDEVKSTEYDVAKNYDWLLEETNNYLKDKAIKKAITDSVDIIEENGDTTKIRKLVEDALCCDLKVSMGLDYWGQLGERLKRIFTKSDIRIPSYYPTLDEYLNGGFPPMTLSIFPAKIHAGKSALMSNIMSRQVIHGHNVGLCTLEMSEDMFAQRFDAIFTMLDINRIYTNKVLRQALVKSLKELCAKSDRGNLFIKAFPTGSACVNDFRIWLREMAIRGNKIDILYCDYINLMKPEYKSKDSLYQDVKKISEELRALAFEFGIPVISVTQLNRTSMFLSLGETEMHSIAESIGLAASVDFMAILGQNDEDMVYQSEMGYKIVKNRLGPGVGVIGKLYIDDRSLKMYDEMELQMWIDDSKVSGGSRDIYVNKSK